MPAHKSLTTSVEILHQENVESTRVLDQAHTTRVNNQFVQVDVGVVLAMNPLRIAAEHPITQLHDVGFVKNRDLLATAMSGEAKGPVSDAPASIFGGHLQAGYHTGDHLVLQSRVKALGVLANDDQVDIFKAGGNAFQRSHRSHRRKQVESLTQPHIDRGKSSADGRRTGPLQSHLVPRNCL